MAFFGGGGGGTGGGPYTVITTTSTLESQKSYMVDTSSSAYTVTLPATPANGDYVEIFDRANSFGINNLTIDRNGNKIESLTENLTGNVNGAAFKLAYADSTTGWQVIPFYGFAGPNFVGATSSTAGTAGVVPAPAAGDQRRLLTGAGTFIAAADQALPTTPIRRTNGIAFASSTASGNGGRATATGYVLCPYIYVFSTKAYTTFSIYVSGAGTASSLGKLAIYNIGSDGAPSSLVCSSGTFATDSIGLKQPTMSSTVVNCGWYFCLVATNSSANVTFYGDAMNWPRGFLSGQVSGAAPVGLDYSQKAYANLWPDPWDGTGNIFSNAYHPVVELT